MPGDESQWLLPGAPDTAFAHPHRRRWRRTVACALVTCAAGVGLLRVRRGVESSSPSALVTAPPASETRSAATSSVAHDVQPSALMGEHVQATEGEPSWGNADGPAKQYGASSSQLLLLSLRWGSLAVVCACLSARTAFMRRAIHHRRRRRRPEPRRRRVRRRCRTPLLDSTTSPPPAGDHPPGSEGDVVLLSYGATNGAPYFGAMPRLWRTGPVPSDTGLPDWMPITEPLLKALPR